MLGVLKMADRWGRTFRLTNFCSVFMVILLISEAVVAHNALNQLAESFGSFLGSFGDGDECQYVCADGSKPRKRLGHSPSSNGCGALGIQLDTSHVPDMTECCHTHDRCYDTCNNDRAFCDVEFKECLEDLCKLRKREISQSEYKNCVGGMNLMYAGTMALGCKPYKEAQAEACVCPGRKPEL